MNGYDSADGYVEAPLDDRDAEDPAFEVDPDLSEMCAHGREHDPLQ